MTTPAEKHKHKQNLVDKEAEQVSRKLVDLGVEINLLRLDKRVLIRALLDIRELAALENGTNDAAIHEIARNTIRSVE